jgi:hypothetical protein
MVQQSLDLLLLASLALHHDKLIFFLDCHVWTFSNDVKELANQIDGLGKLKRHIFRT